MLDGPPDPEPDDVGAAVRLLLLFTGLASAGVALQAWFAPVVKMPWPLPPLHAASFAALQAASAVTWILAARERDSAVLRIPLVQMMAGSACTLLMVTLLRGSEPAALEPMAWTWLAWHAGMAVGAIAWLHHRSEIQAPAERSDRTLFLAAIVSGALALLLAVDADRGVTAKTWLDTPAPPLAYAGQLAGWAVALVMVSRERRRSARRPSMWGLMVLGCLLSMSSCLLLGSFRHPVQGLASAAGSLVLSVLAWRRLAAPDRHWRRSVLRRGRPSGR